MSDTPVLPADNNRRSFASGDRRVLHRGDDGRRREDAAPTTNTFPPDDAVARPVSEQPVAYLVAMMVAFAVLWGAVIFVNMRLNPLFYVGSAQREVAEAFQAGKSYANFDLNVDIRGIRREHIPLLPEAPEISVIGASHWQEGLTSLFPDQNFYNAHVHRDYFEDILGVSEMFVANDRLPETLIISIRELTFTPVSARTDYLWVTGTSDYRAMARRLGLEPQSWFETFVITPWLDLTSLPSAWNLAKQWFLAEQRPGPTTERVSQSLDTLHPGGYITWSRDHDAIFTHERMLEEAHTEFAFNQHRRIVVDPDAVNAVDRLLSFLIDRGVRVILAHPPFNPVYYDALMKTPYGTDLQGIVSITADMAAKHGIPVIGSFDGDAIGCGPDLFIDSQHGRPECLAKLVALVPPRDPKN